MSVPADQLDRDGAAAPRPVARKLTLRVNGTRVGDPARPQASGPAAAGPRTRRFGLRVHTSAVAERIGNAAASSASRRDVREGDAISEES